MTANSREKTLRSLLFIGPALVTIFVIDSVVTDPVNTPKLFILGVLSFGMLGSVAHGIRKEEIFESRVPLALLSIFLLISTITLFTSKAPFIQSVYGVYGRNNGYLTYLFFALIFMGCLFVTSLSTHLRIVHSLFIAGVVNVAYCGWVILYGDFLSWSNPYGNILGTFGNPNFIGAFLGMFFVAWFAILMGPTSSKFFRYSSLLVLPLTAVEIYLSRAIQGRVLMVGGSALVIFYWIRFRFKSRIILAFYSIFALGCALFALAGALQIGPLTGMIYKTSVSLRGQYWLAAWNTGKEHPWTGVGFDSLGDWYRRMRDAHALELPGIDTVINTAHNVPLDLFAFGGWPLLISYLGLVVLTGFEILRFSKKLNNFDAVFIALTVTWVSFQIQSLISINQIGLGFWGWLLSGSILSYVRISTRLEGIASPTRAGKSRNIRKSNNPISSGLVSSLAMVVGALLAVPPLASDMKWMSAQDSRDAAKVELSLTSGYMNPGNTQKYLMAIQLFEQSNLTELSHKYALDAIEFNPNTYDAWKLLSLLQNSTNQEKQLALDNMRRLDPLNPTLKSQ